MLSEDEMRYQPQMSLTPPNGFLHTSNHAQKKKSVSKNIADKISVGANSSSYHLHAMQGLHKFYQPWTIIDDFFIAL